MLNLILQLFWMTIVWFFLWRLYKTNLLTWIIWIVYLWFFILVGWTIEYTLAIQIIAMGFFYSEKYETYKYFDTIFSILLVIAVAFLFVDWVDTLPVLLLAIFWAGLWYHISKIVREFKINELKYFKYFEILIFICLLVWWHLIFVNDWSYISYWLPLVCFASVYVNKKEIIY